jgi:UDP-2,3-diacylglucosamine pyrophosphatase LpxH
MRSLFGRTLLPFADNAELFTSQGREIMMSFSENLLIDETPDSVIQQSPGFMDKEFWSHDRKVNLKAPESSDQLKTTRVRSLFLSDLHLGFRHSRVQSLLEFLNRHEPENLYLVGDFIDGWCLQSRWHWQAECNLIVARLMDLANSGTRIRLAIGNHDNFLRGPMMLRFIEQCGMVEVAEEFHHRTADGRQFLILHGDQFDHYEQASSFTVGFLSLFYEGMLRANSIWSRVTSAALHGNGSFVGRLKRRLKSIGRHVGHFRNQIVRHARHRGVDGVICGHIHAPQHIEIDGVTYCNAGDWVENCTALIEDRDGELRLAWL